MNSITRIKSIFTAACIGGVVAVFAFAAPAHAADAVFPTGSQLGIVSPAGMVPSHNFEGFENPDTHAAILFNVLPPAAYDQLDKSMVPEAMKKQGIKINTREPIQLAIGKGFILSGRQTTNNRQFRKWLHGRGRNRRHGGAPANKPLLQVPKRRHGSPYARRRRAAPWSRTQGPRRFRPP